MVRGKWTSRQDGHILSVQKAQGTTESALGLDQRQGPGHRARQGQGLPERRLVPGEPGQWSAWGRISGTDREGPGLVCFAAEAAH